MSRTYCGTSAVVFALVSLMHLWRFVLDVPLTLSAWTVPRSVSLIAGLAAGALALWAFRSLRASITARVVYT